MRHPSTDQREAEAACNRCGARFPEWLPSALRTTGRCLLCAFTTEGEFADVAEGHGEQGVVEPRLRRICARPACGIDIGDLKSHAKTCRSEACRRWYQRERTKQAKIAAAPDKPQCSVCGRVWLSDLDFRRRRCPATISVDGKPTTCNGTIVAGKPRSISTRIVRSWWQDDSEPSKFERVFYEIANELYRTPARPRAFIWGSGKAGQGHKGALTTDGRPIPVHPVRAYCLGPDTRRSRADAGLAREEPRNRTCPAPVSTSIAGRSDGLHLAGAPVVNLSEFRRRHARLARALAGALDQHAEAA